MYIRISDGKHKGVTIIRVCVRTLLGVVALTSVSVGHILLSSLWDVCREIFRACGIKTSTGPE